MLEIRIVVIDSSAALMATVFALRHEVFVIEQAVPPELERDEFDVSAIHIAAMYGDDVVGTLRIVALEGSAKIGRMAVRATARRSGVGSSLMSTAETVASRIGAREVVLHAQLTAQAFYSKLGYHAVGGTFEEAGIMHVEMRKTLA